MLKRKRTLLKRFIKFSTLLEVSSLSTIKYVKDFEYNFKEEGDFSFEELCRLRQKWILKSPSKAAKIDDPEQCTRVIENWVETNQRRAVSAANVQVLMEVHRSQSFAHDISENIDFLTTHSIPVIWVLNQVGVSFRKLIGATEIFLRLCEYCHRNRKKIFLLSNQLDVCEQVQERLLQEFPALKVVGYSHVCTSSDLTVDEKIIDQVNQSGASLVCVSLPHPFQERWIAKHRCRIDSVLFGVDRTFQSYSKHYKDAPRCVHLIGFAWLYQLVQKPIELFRSYKNSLPAFIWLFLTNQFINLDNQHLSHTSQNNQRVRELLERIYVPI